MSQTPVFAFTKQNYLLIVAGIAIIIVGFFTMSGGGSSDPNIFEGDYTLTDESFEMMNSNFKVEDGVVEKIASLQNKVFASEEDLKAELKSMLGNSFTTNYFNIRSATHIDAAIFSTRRITIAPMIILLGYVVILIGIMRKTGSTKEIELDTVDISYTK